RTAENLNSCRGRRTPWMGSAIFDGGAHAAARVRPQLWASDQGAADEQVQGTAARATRTTSGERSVRHRDPGALVIERRNAVLIRAASILGTLAALCVLAPSAGAVLVHAGNGR